MQGLIDNEKSFNIGIGSKLKKKKKKENKAEGVRAKVSEAMGLPTQVMGWWLGVQS